jgi:AraC family transcriptional regulator, regulatory protein of adaptative response / methylated-DNA-[protein]-cysteine methyltransferase
MLNEEEFWLAVQERDTNYDGRFVYGVQSTGIYCRPSCSSRRPKREHIRFFASVTEAENSGFRPCRRCQPEKTSFSNSSAELIERTCRLIEADLQDTFTLAQLGRKVGSSPYHLQRLFKRQLGLSPRQYAENCRLARFKELLQSGKPVTSALYEAGFSSSSRLYERAQQRLGMSPAVYRRGGEGIDISFAVKSSPIGSVLMAATVKGICAVYFGDDPGELPALLYREFPLAKTKEEETPELMTWLSQLQQYLAGQISSLTAPLAILGASQFQQQVWETLKKIPYGQVSSYAEIAREIKQPGAARAVGHACASNPIAIFIPCHRAVRSNGGLAGYRWGLVRKEALLALERAYTIEKTEGETS